MYRFIHRCLKTESQEKKPVSKSGSPVFSSEVKIDVIAFTLQYHRGISIKNDVIRIRAICAPEERCSCRIRMRAGLHGCTRRLHDASSWEQTKAKKKKCWFRVTRPTLFFPADPKTFYSFLGGGEGTFCEPTKTKGK